MDINEINILDIQPSQFYISQEKIKQIKSWFNPNDLSNFEPVPIKLLNDKIIFTDGHTRAFVAHCAGLSQIPLIWDTDELDWEVYKICVNACIKRNIKSIRDLSSRTLPAEEYKNSWNVWCNVVHEVLELQSTKPISESE